MFEAAKLRKSLRLTPNYLKNLERGPVQERELMSQLTMTDKEI